MGAFGSTDLVGVQVLMYVVLGSKKLQFKIQLLGLVLNLQATAGNARTVYSVLCIRANDDAHH